MLDIPKQEWAQSNQLNMSLLGKPTELRGQNKSNTLEVHLLPSNEVVPYSLFSEKQNGKLRKRFQARSSGRRNTDIESQFYLQEKLVEAAHRRRESEAQSATTNNVQHCMGVFHIQSSLLQKLAREENKAAGLCGCSRQLCHFEETNPQMITISKSQDLLRDVGSAIATLW